MSKNSRLITHNSQLPPSELQTHRKLDYAWPAAGDAGGGAHGSCDGATHGCGDFAEIRIALVVLRIRKIRMVEHIEELGAELQAKLFSEFEPLQCREVVILQTRAVVLVAAGGTDASSWRSSGEVRLIKRCIDIPVVLLKPSGTDNVGPVVELVKPAEVLCIVKHGERGAGLKRRAAGDLPTAKDLFIQGVVPSKQTMTRTDRRINHKRDDGAMPDVKRRWPTFRSHVIDVGNAPLFS